MALKVPHRTSYITMFAIQHTKFCCPWTTLEVYVYVVCLILAGRINSYLCMIAKKSNPAAKWRWLPGNFRCTGAASYRCGEGCWLCNFLSQPMLMCNYWRWRDHHWWWFWALLAGFWSLFLIMWWLWLCWTIGVCVWWWWSMFDGGGLCLKMVACVWKW